MFKEQVTQSLDLKIALKTSLNLIEAVEHFNTCIQEAAWSSIPLTCQRARTSKTSPNIREKILQKRRARKVWQQTRHPADKAVLNSYTKQLKKLLTDEKTENFRTT